MIQTEMLLTTELPPIPTKCYFTISEVAELCQVKQHTLRYWEQEFTQLHQVKRRGNRRYYQRHEVLLIRQIRSLIHEEGLSIAGVRNRLASGKAPVGDASMHRLPDQTVQQWRSDLQKVLDDLDALLGAH